MAQMEGLYLGMGIDTSQLNSDFIDAEKTINQNLARINKEMQLVKIKGQVKLEGLEENASLAEKLRVQEEALNAQISLQQDKIILLGATYEHLLETKGEYSEVTKQVEYQLAREQLATQRLQNQLADLSEQEKIAIGFNFEMLALLEPLWKGLETAVAEGLALPIPMLHAKAAVAGVVGLAALAAGTAEATDEFRENNPVTILDESVQQASVSIDNSVQRIDDSWQRVVASTQNSAEQIHNSIENVSSDFELFGMKIFPEFNEIDFIRFVKILEDFRPSEAIVNTIELISQSESLLGKLSSALIGLGYTAATIGEPLLEFAQTSVDSFRELSKAAKELNLSLDKTSDLTTKIELAGGEYEDVRDYVRGVQDAVIKGDSEDPEVLALEKYGVVIQDTNGKLLAFDETLERLYQGYLKAREAGEAEAYVMMTNGQALHDVLPYFEGVAKAEEDMAKIKWATLDYATLEELSNQMKLVDMQTEELKKSLSSLAAPAANIFLKDTLGTLKSLTEIIEENREKVIYWSFVLVEGIKSLEDYAMELGGEAKDNIIAFGESLTSVAEGLGIISKVESLFADEPPKDLAEEAKENLIPFYTELKKLEEEFGVISKLGNFLPEDFTAELDNATENYLVPFYQTIKDIKEEFSITNKLKSFLPNDLFSGLDLIFNRAQERLEEFKKANEEARKVKETVTDYLAGLSYSQNRIRKYKLELENLKFDMQYGKDFSYEKALAQNKLWYDEAMKDAKYYADEKAIIEELYAAKSEQIEQERADKLAEIRESIASADKTALEQKLDTIEKEKQSWIKVGMDEAEATELAQKQKVDYIKKIEEELSNNLQSLYNTELENRLSQIEQEKQAWIDKCGDEVKATKMAEQAKADAQRNAAMSVLKQQAEEYEAYQKGGYGGLRAYKAAQLAEQGIKSDYLYMTPQQLEKFQKANQVADKSMLPNFMTEHDHAEHARQMQEWRDFQAKQQANYDEQNYVIVDGVKKGLSEVLSGVEFRLGKNDSEESHTIKLEPDGTGYTRRDDKYSYDQNGRLNQQDTNIRRGYLPAISEPENYEEILRSVQDVSESFSELPVAIQGTTETLNELPTIVQGISESLSDLVQQYSEMPASSELQEIFQGLPTVIQKASDSLNDLPIAISGVTEKLSEIEMPSFVDFNQSVQEVTIKIGDLSAALENILSIKGDVPTSEQRVPVEVTTNVQIDEAHAWDYDHIAELADKVAALIKPEIISAIGGGDSNSY